MKTTIAQVPKFRDYAGTTSDDYSHIRLGGVTITEWQANMSDAQAAGFFSAVDDFAPSIRDWMKRDGSHTLRIYTMGTGDQNDHVIIGYADNVSADFSSIAEFILCAKEG